MMFFKIVHTYIMCIVFIVQHTKYNIVKIEYLRTCIMIFYYIQTMI